MKKRLSSMLLVLVMMLGMLPATALAASSEAEALGEVSIYNGGQKLSYLSINGRVRELIYTYFNYMGENGKTKEIPAYCVNPNTKGVPQTVASGQSIKYLAEEKGNDPKVMGIIANGYPTRGLAELKLENKYHAYYATKMALWCYLLPNWNINNLKVNPNLTGTEFQRAQAILTAAKDIYVRGTAWSKVYSPRVTATPDRDAAYATTVNGQQYKQQVFTIHSDTWVCNYAVRVAFTDPSSIPAGTRIVDMDNNDIMVTTSDGTVVGDANGKFVTDSAGSFTVSGITPGTVLVVKETRAKAGYLLDDAPQTATIKAGQTVTLEFRNQPQGSLIINKLSSADKKTPLEGVLFQITYSDGSYVDNGALSSKGLYRTDKNGQIILSGITGTVIVTEVETIKGYRIDDASRSQTIEVRANDTQQLWFYNTPISGILIHKISSVDGKAIPGVTFLLYDSANIPIAQATSDDRGYAYFEDLPAGRYSLRELENEGYVRDTQKKTVYVKSGETTEVEWENTPITGQIQITKRSADYNPTNGLPAGTLLEGAVFEIADKAGNVVDTIRSNSRGLAISKQLPLSRYFIREVKAPEHYGISEKELTVYLEYEGQIARLEVEDKSLTTGVSITKTGPKEIMANQPVRYAFSNIANTSNVSLSNFYWRDTLPAQVRLEKVVTGTYNFSGTYKIVYRANGGDYRTLADNLSTSKNYTLAASSVALGLASNERVTEIMFVFGQAPAGFSQVEAPYLHCKAVAGLPAGSFVNVADVGGTYNGTWVQAVSRWVISVYGKPAVPKLPRTGY